MRAVAVTGSIELDGEYFEKWIEYYSQFFDRLTILYEYASEKRKSDLAERGISTEMISSTNEIAVNHYVYGMLSSLFTDYDVVCYTSMDEFIIPDPNKYKNLREYMKKMDFRATCRGFDVRQIEGDKPLDFSKKLLKQRRYWTYAPPYNKTLIHKIPFSLVMGSHYTTDMAGEARRRNTHVQNVIDEYVDKDLILVHFRRADMSIFNAQNEKYRSYNLNFQDGLDSIKKIPERFKII